MRVHRTLLYYWLSLQGDAKVQGTSYPAQSCQHAVLYCEQQLLCVFTTTAAVYCHQAAHGPTEGAAVLPAASCWLCAAWRPCCGIG